MKPCCEFCKDEREVGPLEEDSWHSLCPCHDELTLGEKEEKVTYERGFAAGAAAERERVLNKIHAVFAEFPDPNVALPIIEEYFWTTGDKV